MDNYLYSCHTAQELQTLCSLVKTKEIADYDWLMAAFTSMEIANGDYLLRYAVQCSVSSR